MSDEPTVHVIFRLPSGAIGEMWTTRSTDPRVHNPLMLRMKVKHVRDSQPRQIAFEQFVNARFFAQKVQEVARLPAPTNSQSYRLPASASRRVVIKTDVRETGRLVLQFEFLGRSEAEGKRVRELQLPDALRFARKIRRIPNP